MKIARFLGEYTHAKGYSIAEQYKNRAKNFCITVLERN